MANSDHDIERNIISQYSTEARIYTVDVTNVGLTADGTVASPDMTVYEISSLTDVTSSVTTGSMSVSGQVITLKKIQTLEKGKKYRVDVTFTKDGSSLDRRIRIDCPTD